jgi:hypothetical protein
LDTTTRSDLSASGLRPGLGVAAPLLLGLVEIRLTRLLIRSEHAKNGREQGAEMPTPLALNRQQGREHNVKMSNNRACDLFIRAFAFGNTFSRFIAIRSLQRGR